MIEPSSTTSRSTRIKAGIVLFLLLIAVILTLQNSESIEVVFLLWQFSLPRALIIFVVFLIGFLSGLAFSNWKVLTGSKTKIEPYHDDKDPGGL